MSVFEDVLRTNGYPDDFISGTKHLPSKQERKRHSLSGSHHLYFRFPYISDTIDRQVRNIFRKEKMEVRLTRRSKTLRGFLNTRERTNKPCCLSGCPVQDKTLCFRRLVVYRLTCTLCGQFYIGSTIRDLHQRCKEHATDQRSSMFQHLRSCGSYTFLTSVIGRDIDEVNLRLRESALILKMKPQINSKAEQLEFRAFLF